MEFHTSHILIGVVIFLAVTIVVLARRRSKARKHNFTATLLDKTKVSHDTILLTFTMPKDAKLKIVRSMINLSQFGQSEFIFYAYQYYDLTIPFNRFIHQLSLLRPTILGSVETRQYTPVSRASRVGSFELLVKVYHPSQRFPRGGTVSQWLNKLAIGGSVPITMPYGRFEYISKGTVRIRQLSGNIRTARYSNLMMVAGGTGITPIYQIMQHIVENEQETGPSMTLLFANRSQEDILLRNQLNKMAGDKLKVFFCVDQSPNSNWDGMVGFVDEAKMQLACPSIKDTLFLCCGPPIMCSLIEKIWRQIGISNENMFRF